MPAVVVDYSRVRVDDIEGVGASDYINACYIKGIDGRVSMIAAQVIRVVYCLWIL